MSLNKKLITLFLVCVLLPISLVGALIYQKAKKEFVASRLAQLESVADLKERRIEEFMQERRGDIAVLSEHPLVIGLLESGVGPSIDRRNGKLVHHQYLDGAADKGINESAPPEASGGADMAGRGKAAGEFVELAETMARVYQYKNVILADIGGNYVCSSCGDWSDKVLAPHIESAIRAFMADPDKSMVQSAAMSRPGDGRPMSMLISAPVRDRGGELLGVVSLEVDMGLVLDFVLDNTGMGDTGETLIAERGGDGLVFLTPTRHLVGGGRELWEMSLDKALHGETGSGIETDYNGDEVIAAWRPVKHMDWGLVAKIDTREAFASIRAMRNTGISIVAGVMGLVVALSILVARTVSEPLKDLQKGTEIVGAGNFAHRVDTGKGDEIGQLSRAFDRMSESLAAVTASRDELNREIEERARAEAELKITKFAVDRVSIPFFWIREDGHFAYVNDAACRSLGYERDELLNVPVFDIDPNFPPDAWALHWKDTGERNSFSIESLHRRKDGTTFPVDITVNRLKAEGADYIFAFAQDVTERKWAEQALLDSEENSRAQYRGIPAPTYTWQKVGESFFLVDFNDAAQSAGLGKAGHFLGVKAEEMYADIPEFVDEMKRCYETEEAVEREIEYASKSTGEDKFLSVKFARIPPDLVLVHAEDVTDRRMTERALAESEERLRRVLQNMPVMMNAYGEDGRVLVWNRECERVTGYSAEEMLAAKAPLDILYPEAEYREWMFEEMEKRGMEYRDLEFQLRCKDGSRRTISWNNISPSFPVRGWHTWAVGVDVTEKWEAELERIKEEKRLQVLLELNHMAKGERAVMADFVLDKAVELTESAIGFLAFVSDDRKSVYMHAWSSGAMDECKVHDKPFIFEIGEKGLWAEALRSGKPAVFNDYPRDHPRKTSLPEGHVPLGNFMVVPLQGDDRIEAIVGVANKKGDYGQGDVRQLTLLIEGMWREIQRREALEALSESERKYRLLFENLNDAALVADSETGIVVDANKQAEILLGRDRGKIIGLHRSDIHPPGKREEYARVFREGLGGGSGTLFGLEVEDAEGKTIPVDISFGEITLGGRDCVLGLFRDVTERMRSAAEREELIGELESKNAELERFTYTVSHDLKSPLITIKGFLGVLEDDMMGGRWERAKSDIGRIANAADKMQDLLDDLLELSRVGRLVNAPACVDLGEVAGEALRLVEGRIRARGVEVQVKPGLPKVMADRKRLREAIQNLVDNAVKFMGDEPAPCVEIGAEERGGRTEFYVRDNGQGIEPRYHDKIFGLFDKLDPGNEGTGVGLALVKRIIEIQGGDIRVESDGPGSGSCFYFTLPLAGEGDET